MPDRFVLCAALLLALGAPAGARALHAVVTHVTDGDTVWIRPAGAGAALQLRLQDIDAPEICQAFGRQARGALAARVLRRRVWVVIRARDVYQRAVGRINLQGDDVGAWLVADGYAWSAQSLRGPAAYAQEEAVARSRRLGLWSAPAPVDPRNFRKQHGPCVEGARDSWRRDASN
jgi:endonuclease YncB( thermonuclease family)